MTVRAKLMVNNVCVLDIEREHLVSALSIPVMLTSGIYSFVFKLGSGCGLCEHTVAEYKLDDVKCIRPWFPGLVR